MARVWFTSDWHLGHNGISTKFRSNFASDEEHDNTLIENYKMVVNKRDVCYFLGDMCFKEHTVDKLKNLPGNKILIHGNHDIKSTRKLLEVFQNVHGAIAYSRYWLTHIPIHPKELYGRKNIHGHVHGNGAPDPEYFSVCPDNPTFGDKWYPITFDEIREYFNG